MVKVSVIIPVYNTENYLKECLDSIVNQTLKDIEIICINDGSTDKSLDILNSYAEKDKRFKVFSQENQGQGVARNYGLSIATGDYIYFMDSDDTIELTTLKDNYQICEKKDLDFTIFKLVNYDDETEEYYEDELYNMVELYEEVGDKVFNYENMGELMFKATVSPANKLYNHDFIKEFNIKFKEDLIFEDNIFYWNAILNARRISFYDEYLYIRRRHSNSTTGKGTNKLMDTIKINNLIIDIFKNHGLFEDYKSNLYNLKTSLMYLRFSQVKEELKEVFLKEIKKDIRKTLEEEPNILDYLDDRNKLIFKSFNSTNNTKETILIITHFDLIEKKKYYEKENKYIKRQIKRYKKKNKSLLNSNSWKITKPLRSKKRK